MDRSLSPACRRAGHTRRCLGPRKFALLVRRRNPRDSRLVWPRSAVHKTGRARPRTLERKPGAVEAEIFLSDWRPVDGRRLRRVRTRLAAAAERSWHSFRGTFNPGNGATLAANQLRQGRMG